MGHARGIENRLTVLIQHDHVVAALSPSLGAHRSHGARRSHHKPNQQHDKPSAKPIPHRVESELDVHVGTPEKKFVRLRNGNR